MFMVPLGISSAAAAILGERIGANEVGSAKAYFRLMCLITLGLVVVV